MQEITNHPVYQQILSDSFGGVMYDVANKGKYNTKELVALWDNLPESYKSASGGIMKGVFNFLAE